MPTFQTPKTYLQIFHTKLLKIIFNNISRKFFYKYFADTNKMFIFVVLKKQRDI